MKNRVVLVLSVSLLLLACFFSEDSIHIRAEPSDGLPVHNVSTALNYTSIQGAIDASETADGNTILVDAGTYNTTLILDKSLTMIGSEGNTALIDGGGASLVVHVIANDVRIEGFTVTDGRVGVYFDHSNNSVFRGNNVTGMTYPYAVYAAYSENLTMDRNMVGPNSCSGILITDSSGFRISSNHVLENQGYGINSNSSINGVIDGNDVYGNIFDGIGLSRGCRNITVTGNSMGYNGFGIDVIDPDCVDNVVYDNNFVNNSKQASVFSANFWDNGLEGNYWSDYAGVDEDHNGIGDQPYNLSANNVDDYPLMGVFSVFETSLGLDVDVVSNSSIAAFAYFVSNGTIRMRVLNSSVSQTYGFCRVRVPHGLMTGPYNVTVDGAAPLYLNSTLHDDGGSRWFYLAYQQSAREVLIQGRPPPPTVSVISPENKTYTVSDVPLTFVVDEPASWLAYSMDGGNNVTITGNTTLLSVSNGTHSLVVYARNIFGDTGASETVSFTVNPTAAGPFWLLVAVAVVAVAAVLAAVLVYVKKLRRRRSKSG